MKTPARTFEDRPAVREEVPLLIGLSGPSGSGKTYSALRLATGIQRVTGGEIYFIDTESKRSLHYADKFKFQFVPFAPPFSPLDYLAAIQHCVRKGAKTIVVDSMSHEHEGPGGILEMHAAAVERMSRHEKTEKERRAKAERVKMLAWAEPKQQRRRLINSVLQLQCNIIFCFRAKEKLKIVKGKEPEPLGWQPIAGDEFIYEMTVHAFMYPGADGVPTWHSNMPGERAMMKLPGQFAQLLRGAQPFDERMGEEMARWAKGDAPAKSNPGAKFGKVDWSGAAEWTGKPLAAASEAELRDYRNVLADAIAAASGKRKAAMEANIAAVDALLPYDGPEGDEWPDEDPDPQGGEENLGDRGPEGEG